MDIPETLATLGTRHNLKKRNKIKKTLHGQLKRWATSMDPDKKTGVNPDAHEGAAVPVYY